MTTNLPRRTYLQSRFKITPVKTITLSAGANTLAVVSLVAGIIYRTINFIIADFDVTGTGTLLKVVANSAADGSGTDIELYTSVAILVANDQTCVAEVDMAYVSSVCDLLSGGFVPKSVCLKVTGATNTNTLALCTVLEPMGEALGTTPSSISLLG